MTLRLFSPLVLFLLLVFLIGPFLIIIAASLSSGDTLAFPPQGLSLRWVMKVFTIESFRDSFAMAIVAVAPIPGSTPISVPSSTPIRQKNRFSGVPAVAKPSARLLKRSIIVS